MNRALRTAAAASLGAGAVVAAVMGGWWAAMAAAAAALAVRVASPPGTAAPRVPTLGLMEELAHEVERARRHGRPLAVVRIPAPEVGDVNPALDAVLRITDRRWRWRGELVLALPETDRAGAGVVLGRLAHLVDAGLRTAEAGVAVFPDDALTTTALFEGAAPVRRVRRHLVPVPRPVDGLSEASGT